MSSQNSTMAAASSKKGLPCESFPFFKLCEQLKKVAEAKSTKRSEILNNLWEQLSRPPGVAPPFERQSLYPLMRLLLPHLDLKRTSYSMREKVLAAMFIEVLSIPEKSADAQSLLHYTNPRKVKTSAQMPKAVGQFSDVLHQVLVHRIDAVPSGMRLTLGDVNKFLDELSDVNTKADRRKELFRMTVLRRMSPEEIRWLIRIIMKDLKIGVKHEQMLKWLYPAPKGQQDALELWNCRTDLEEVCLWVLNPFDRGSMISPFSAIKPMLSKKIFGEKQLRKVVGNGHWMAEIKFDGERMMLHKHKGALKLFSRNCLDYTNRYDYGAAFAAISVHLLSDDCILDGEVVAWNEQANRFEPFGSNRSAAQAGLSDAVDSGDEHDDDNADNGRDQLLDELHADPAEARPVDVGIQLCYVAFDCLWLNGKSLMSQPLTERRAALSNAIRVGSKRLQIVEQTEVVGFEVALRKLEESVRAGNEGVILKDNSTSYVPGDRGDRWLKLKPDYFDGHATMDLIVLGAYYGEGKRRSGDVSHFLLGVAERPAFGGQPTSFYTICKVGTGYSLDELNDLRARLAPHWQEYRTDVKYAHLRDWVPERDDRPHKILPPNKSVIFQIKAFELVKSAVFSAGMTFRFPRVEKIRYDKAWFECETMHDANKVFLSKTGLQKPSQSLQSQALPSQAASLDLNFSPSAVTSPVAIKRTQNENVCSTFQAADLAGVARETSVFEDCVFCVLTDGPMHFKADLERSIHAAGGRCVQHPLPTVTHYIAESRAPFHVSSLIASWTAPAINKKRKHTESTETDIWLPKWVTESFESGQLQPLSPQYILYATAATTAKLARIVDVFGDSFTTHLDDDRLTEVLQNVDQKVPRAFRASATATIVKSENSGVSDSQCDLIAQALQPQTSVLQVFDLLFESGEQEALALQSDVRLFPLLGCRIYWDRHEPIGGALEKESELDTVAIQAAAHGATSVTDPDLATHIVTAPDHPRRVRPRLTSLLKCQATLAAAHRTCARVVTSEWVTRCLMSRSGATWQQDESMFAPVVNPREARVPAV